MITDDMRLETDGKVNNRKLAIAIDVLLALMLGGACFYVFISMFGLKWPGTGIFSGSISGGLAGIWDKIADKLGSLDYVILPKYKANMTSGGNPVCGTALTMILIAFSVISYFIIKARTRLLMLLFAIPLGFVMLVYGLTPSVFAGAFFAAAVIIVLAVMRMDEDLDLKFFMMPGAMLLACIIVVALLNGTVSLSESKDLANSAKSVKAAIDRIRYGSDPLPSGDLGRISGKDLKKSRGDIESVKQELGQAGGTVYGSDYDYFNDSTTDDYYGETDQDTSEESSQDSSNSAGSKTALTVSMSTPESYYLRGFIGATYNKNKWSTLSNETFYGMRDTVFWLNRRNFDGLSEMSRAAELGGIGDFAGSSQGDFIPETDVTAPETTETPETSETPGITFEDDGTSEEPGSQDTYDAGTNDTDTGSSDPDDDEPDIEMSVEDDDEEEDDGGEYNTMSFIDAVYADGEDSGAGNKISIKVKGASRRNAFVPYELYLEPAKGNKARESEMVLPKGTKNYGGSHLGTKGFAGRSSYSYTADTNITGMWTDAVGKLYTALQTEAIQDYFISESHYNVMQYENYLDVPDRLKQTFSMELGSAGDLSDEHAEYKETIERVQNYLSSSYIYSETFNKPQGKEDVVEKFMETRSGCDMHFATLATLLFRYYGIPARYVEGYLVTPQMVQSEDAAKGIDVPKAANHAWTEIYIDGFGWVPFEATPDYRGIMQEANMEIGLQNVDYEYTPPEPDDTEDEEPYEDDEEDDTRIGKKLLELLQTIIILAIIILLIYLAFKFGHVLIEERRWKKAFADKDPKKGIRALYQYALMKGWKLSSVAEGLGLRASYSEETMLEGERKVMLDEFEKAKAQAKKDSAAEKAHEKVEKAKAKEEAKKEKAEAKAAAKEEKAEAKAAAKEQKAEAKAAAVAAAEVPAETAEAAAKEETSEPEAATEERKTEASTITEEHMAEIEAAVEKEKAEAETKVITDEEMAEIEAAVEKEKAEAAAEKTEETSEAAAETAGSEEAAEVSDTAEEVKDVE